MDSNCLRRGNIKHKVKQAGDHGSPCGRSRTEPRGRGATQDPTLVKRPLRGEEVTNSSRDVKATKDRDAQTRVNAVETFFKVKAKIEGEILRRELLMQRQETLVRIPDLVKVIYRDVR